MMRRLAIGADHAGYSLKEDLKRYLEEQGVTVVDMGAHSAESVDYPEFGAKVGRAVAAGEADLGILVCGTGTGIGISANKIAGVRAASVSEPVSARLSREHNNANVVCIGSRIVGLEMAKAILEAWLGADFQGGRHQRRIDKITQLEGSLP